MTFDAGALIALDRNDRGQWALLKALVEGGTVPVIPAPVVTQVWRSSKQANLARAIKNCRIESTDAELARSAGELCAAAGSSDVVDAIVIASASRRGDIVATSDADELLELASHVGHVAIVPV